MTNERKIQHAMALVAMHTGEKNTAKDQDLRIALKLMAECLSPEQVEEARATVRAMKAKAETPAVPPVQISHVPEQSHRTPPRPVTSAPVAVPVPPQSRLDQIIAQFPQEFGFRHFARTVRFTIDPLMSAIGPDGKVLLAIRRQGKDGAPSTPWGKVSPEGLRSQLEAAA